MSMTARLMLLAGGMVLLLLAWWGWQRGGLALRQLGMAIC